MDLLGSRVRVLVGLLVRVLLVLVLAVLHIVVEGLGGLEGVVSPLLLLGIRMGAAAGDGDGLQVGNPVDGVQRVGSLLLIDLGGHHTVVIGKYLGTVPWGLGLVIHGG